MKKLKVMYNGKKLREIYPHSTPFQVFKWKVKKFLRKVFILSLLLATIVVIFKLGGWLNPSTIITQAEVIKEIEIDAPVLDRIAQAESHRSHYCTAELVKSSMCRKSEIGQVLARANSDKYNSIDIGYYQINLYYWGDEASAKGLNLFDAEDNKEMGRWIFKNYGSEPWGSSSKNW